MNEFILKEVINADMEQELNLIGFDSSYSAIGKDKFCYKNFKIFNLTVAQANILKQTALSVGADCATNKNVITGKAELSDVILGGSYSQLRKISQKLKSQPFKLKELSSSILEQLKEPVYKPKLVGILNITENSSSDGGKYLDFKSAKEHLEQMFKDGADIIDIGAESTKPFAEGVNDKIQLERILPLLNEDNSHISIDTRSAVVAEEALKRGVKIINDVSGLKQDPRMAEIIAKYDATVILQHGGVGVNKGDKVEVSIDEVFLDLYNQIEYAKSQGITKIITDVGIGFNKTAENNFELLKRIKEFKSLGYHMMLGISRKSFIDVPQEEKDIFTLALNTLAIQGKVDYIRVHNVKLHKRLIDLLN